MQLNKIIQFLNTNAAGFTVLLTLIAGVYKFWQFVNVKRVEARQRDFENYHQLIEKIIVDRKESDGAPFIDIQIASVFELKNFPHYFPVTRRILMRIKQRLEGKEIQKDLVKQIEETLIFIEK